jgi:hypothetical protein
MDGGSYFYKIQGSICKSLDPIVIIPQQRWTAGLFNKTTRSLLQNDHAERVWINLGRLI